MTLAGNMKLKNFVAIIVVVVLGGVTGLYFACRGGTADKKPETKPEPKSDVKPEPKPEPAKAPDPPKPAPPPAEPVKSKADLAARPYDADVLAWRTKSIKGDKLKDAAKGQPYKLDVFEDAGEKTVNRAKLDLNRNGKWDEKYTFKGDEIVMERAPADDEKYTDTFKWTGTGWSRAN
jgi:hypothetical protein